MYMGNSPGYVKVKWFQVLEFEKSLNDFWKAKRDYTSSWEICFAEWKSLFPPTFPMLWSKGLFRTENFNRILLTKSGNWIYLMVNYLGTPFALAVNSTSMVEHSSFDSIFSELYVCNCCDHTMLCCHCLNYNSFTSEDLLPSHLGVISAKQKQT